MSHARSNFLSHVGVYFLARGLPGIIAFLAIPLLSRLLGAEHYGRYVLVLGGVEMTSALLFQWTRLAMLRYSAVYRDDPLVLRSTLLTVTLLTNALVFAAAALLWALPAMEAWRTPLMFGCVLVLCQSLYELACEQARATLRPWHYMLLQVSRSVGLVGLSFLIIVVLHGTWWAPVAGLAGGMALAIALSFGRDWRGLRLRIDWPVLARLASYGLPLSLTVALSQVIGSSDRYLLAWFLGEAAAGTYAVSFDFTTQTITLLLMVINMAAMPLAIRAYEVQGPPAAQEQMRTNAALLMALGLPAVVGIAVLTGPIVHAALGEEFRAAALTLMPLVAGGALLAGLKAYHFDAAFQFAHRTIHQVWIVLAVAVVNIGLNVAFIPKWGLVGSAIASVLAYILSIGLTIYFGRRQFVLPFPWTGAAQVCVASAAMGAVLWPFRQHLQPWALCLEVAGGAAVYGGCLLAMNFLGLRDALRQRLRSIPAGAPLSSEGPPLATAEQAV